MHRIIQNLQCDFDPLNWRQRFLSQIANHFKIPFAQIIDFSATAQRGIPVECAYHMDPGVQNEFLRRNPDAFIHQPVFLWKPLMPMGYFEFGRLLGERYFACDYYRSINLLVDAKSAGNIFLTNNGEFTPADRLVSVADLANPKSLTPLRWGLSLGFDRLSLKRVDHQRLRGLEKYSHLLGRLLTRLTSWSDTLERLETFEAMLCSLDERILLFRNGTLAEASPPAQSILGTRSSGCAAELLQFAYSVIDSGPPERHWRGPDNCIYRVVPRLLPHYSNSLLVKLELLSKKNAPSTAQLELQYKLDCQLGRMLGLSVRESQVCALVARGLSNKGIAFELGTSPNTVRNQMRSLYAKLQVSSRVEVVVRLKEVQYTR